MRLGLVDLLLAGGLILIDLGLWKWSHAAALIAGGLGAIGVGLVVAWLEKARR